MIGFKGRDARSVRPRAWMTIPLLGLGLMLGAHSMHASSPRVPDYLILGGELGNSSASSKEDIQSIFPRLKDMGLNTVLMPVYWELTEPTEGNFDFSLLDEALSTARENDLKLVLLWFGAWKNSMSCYAPGWVKTDVRRFPRAVTEEGKPLEILSSFSDNVLQADLNAFNAMLDHLKKYDQEGTVSMIQIENEIGMLESPRDHSKLADKEYAKGVPNELASDIGVKPGSSWKETAADPDYADEMFMAWNYARYVEHLAKAAKEVLPKTPLYVNAALDSRGRRPGQYPSAGPIARLGGIWKKGAPSIDFISPDLYDPPFAPWFLQYDFPGNPLFIPEIRRSSDSGTHAFYAIGQHDALGFSPFSIENASPQEAARLKEAYSLLKKLEPYCNDRYESYGLLFDSDNAKESKIMDIDGMKTVASHFFTLPWDSRATDGSRWPDGGGMVIKLEKDEYLIAGTGIVVKWEGLEENTDEKKLGEDGFMLSGEEEKSSEWKGRQRIGILSCDEVDILPDGTLKTIRRLNGDETHQGRHVRIGVDDYKALHVKLYRY
ncbi:MAG: DUF5597 domain-containing protein [Muribaculaceae bacterium]|nr:DUF5597 domain-containing protein [Muribaculaceae bacterium]